MTDLKKIEETFEWIITNCSGAVRAFSIGYPFWSSPELVDLAELAEYSQIFDTLADQMPRYSAICLLRVWDKHKDAASIYKLQNQLTQNELFRVRHELNGIRDQIDRFDSSQSSKILSVMRDKMFAHTEGVAATEENSLPLNEYVVVLNDTLSIVDSVQKLIKPHDPSFKQKAERWHSSINDQLIRLLEVINKQTT